MLYEIITNKVLIIPIFSWAIAQLLKVIVILIQKKRLNLRYLVTSGGMPSSHSAFVSALAASVALTEGLGSVVFGISTVLALVVMYDAAGVRQTVCTQSTMLNHIVEELFKGNPEFQQRVKELIGHTKFEVAAGAILGIVFAFLLSWQW